MRSGAEVHVLATKRRDLAVAQTSLNGDEQKGLIPSSDPCARIGGSHKGRGLFFSQKLHWSSLKTFGRDRQDPLTLQGKRWFTYRYELEKRVDRGQAVVSRAPAVAALTFEVIEKLSQERRIEIFSAQFGR
jgi:hypothetical protein